VFPVLDYPQFESHGQDARATMALQAGLLMPSFSISS